MKLIQQLTYLFFVIAILEIIGGLYSSQWSIYICKPLMSIILMILYFKTETKEKEKVLYYISLVFATLFHIFFIFKDQEVIMLTCGLHAFIIYYSINIIMAKKVLKKVHLLPVFIAITPFILITSIETYELKSYFNGLSISVIIAGSILATFFGFALYSCFLNANKKTILLVTSAICIAISSFTFALDNFYDQLLIFKISTIIGNTVALYTFYKFMVTENTKKLESFS